MSQEKKNYLSNSNKIPTFDAIGSGRDNNYMQTLPPFNKAANNQVDVKHVPLIPNQIPNNTNYHQERPIKYITENNILDAPTNQNKLLRVLMTEKKQEGVIDLTGCNVNTGQQIQIPSKPNSNLRPQLHPSMIPNNYNTMPGNCINEQYISQSTKTDHARFILDPSTSQRKPFNSHMYATQLMQNDQHQTNQILSQQKTMSTATNTFNPAHKLPADYNKSTAQYTQHPQSVQHIQLQQRDKQSAVATRDPLTSTMHTEDTLQKNNIHQAQMQHNPYQQQGVYSKVKQQYGEKPVQNTGLNGYHNTQQMYPVKQMDNKHEFLYKKQPNPIQQEAIHGRHYALNDSVMSSNFGTTQLLGQQNYVSNGIPAKNIQMENTQVPKTGYKQNPISYPRQYQNQLISTQDQQNVLKPMTTPRPTTIPDENTAWQGTNAQFYDFNNNNAEYHYQDGMTNEMNKLMEDMISAKVSKYSQYPEAEKQIQLIKEELLMTEVKPSFPMTSAPSVNYGYGYAPQEASARKRPNEDKSLRVESTKKQTILSQYPTGYVDSYGMYENTQNIVSPPNYNDPSLYDMNHNSIKQQSYHSQIHQSSYQMNSSEMNHIVPTSSSLHSSPISNRIHDSPGADPLAKKRRDEDQEYSTKISDEYINW